MRIAREASDYFSLSLGPCHLVVVTVASLFSPSQKYVTFSRQLFVIYLLLIRPIQRMVLDYDYLTYKYEFKKSKQQQMSNS